jgi:hypothetical protein
LHGISEELDTIEKLAAFLKEELKGFKSYFIGSSAGGYIATLLGGLLNADRVYNFNGQFFLTDLLESSKDIVDPLIFREESNPKINQYYHIKPFIKNPSKIFYFHSNQSDWDIRQYHEVKEIKMNVVNINTGIHGVPLLKNNLLDLFEMKENELKALTERKLHPIVFSIKIIGFWKTVFFMIKMLPNAYKRWVYNPVYAKFKKK